MTAHRADMQMYFEFALWAHARATPPSIKEIEGYFQVSRQSAWRIHKRWMRAHQSHRERTGK